MGVASQHPIRYIRGRICNGEPAASMIERAQVIEALRGVPWFHGLGDDEAWALIEHGTARRYAAGVLIYKEDEIGDRLLVVLNGMLRVEATDADGSAFRVGSVRAGELAGEMAVFDPAPRNASVYAGTEVLALELSRDQLFSMRNQHRRLLMAIATVAINNAMDRIDAVNSRIERELHREPLRVLHRSSQSAPLPTAPTADPGPVVSFVVPGHLPRSPEPVDEPEAPVSRLSKIWAKLTRF